MVRYPDLASKSNVFKHILKSCDNFLFDCDGVLWQGNVAIKGASEVINQLVTHGKKVLFVTNNSTKSREQYLQKLTNLGFTATKDVIFGTAYTSALYLKNEIKVQGKVYIVGNESMAEELHNAGIAYFGLGPDNAVVTQSHPEIAGLKLESNVSAVLVGFDGHLSFTKLIKAASYLRDPNCTYVATNDDSRMPMVGSHHVIPGTGCMVNSVTTAAGKPPDVLCGKPGNYMFKCIQDSFKLDPNRTIMMGDRMNTDMLFGKRNKLKTALVLTGIETKESIEQAVKSDQSSLNEQVPDYYMSSIADWCDLFSSK